MFTDRPAERSAWAPPLARLALNGPTMGSRWTAIVHAGAGRPTIELQATLQGAVDLVDAQMSTWRPGSDLNRINAAPVGRWVDVPPELIEVLAAGIAVSRASGGAFDIGVGDLVAAWGFGAQAARTGPVPAQAASCCDLGAAPQSLEIDTVNRRVRKHVPLVLDLSGIAKGYGVDRLVETARGFGIASGLFGIDGEIRALGAKPDGSAWAIALEAPDRTSRGTAGVIELVDAAIATSGTYRQYRDVGGRCVSHTIDPRTRAPIANDLASVSVIAETAMLADAWATALLVLGPEAGSALAKRLNLSVVMLRGDGEQIERFASWGAQHLRGRSRDSHLM
ncbi:MAG: FAD:protein FMN transferase [Ancalomicrobiaceae bacterium]|nr:FAD:protein FMN transferase [Ancalomicrobiaceae bacterium]